MKLFSFYPKAILAKGLFAVFVFFSFLILTIHLSSNNITKEKLLMEKLEKTIVMNGEEKKAVLQKLQELSKDTDSDGLKDWEEIIYRTDPNNSDSDQDGTFDGEEIKINRNPLIAFPNDVLQESINSKYGNLQTSVQRPENLKNNLTHSLINKLLTSVQPINGGNSGEVEINELILKSLGSEIKTFNPQMIISSLPAPALKKDFIITAQNDALSVKKYFNSIYDEIYKKFFIPLNEELGPVFTVLEAQESRNFDLLKKIDKFIVAYEKSIEAFKKIPVPSGYEDFAIEEINYYIRDKAIIEGLRQANTDPLKAYTMMGAKFAIAENMTAFHEDTEKKLKEKEIAFEKNEGGFFLFQ